MHLLVSPWRSRWVRLSLLSSLVLGLLLVSTGVAGAQATLPLTFTPKSWSKCSSSTSASGRMLATPAFTKSRSIEPYAAFTSS